MLMMTIVTCLLNNLNLGRLVLILYLVLYHSGEALILTWDYSGVFEWLSFRYESLVWVVLLRHASCRVLRGVGTFTISCLEVGHGWACSSRIHGFGIVFTLIPTFSVYSRAVSVDVFVPYDDCIVNTSLHTNIFFLSICRRSVISMWNGLLEITQWTILSTYTNSIDSEFISLLGITTMSGLTIVVTTTYYIRLFLKVVLLVYVHLLSTDIQIT